jgi:hypothetical protein
MKKNMLGVRVAELVACWLAEKKTWVFNLGGTKNVNSFIGQSQSE